MTVLEPMPKWKLLEEIVVEVAAEKAKLRVRMMKAKSAGASPGAGAEAGVYTRSRESST